MSPDVLSDLQREVTSLRTEVTALRSAPAAKRPPHRRPRRFLAALLAAALLVTMPLGLFAANFQDLNPGSPHNANINAIAAAGISKGCGDTQHYCPNNYVSREEMASFLARTAGLGNNSPVTNAATLQGKGPGDFLPATGDLVMRYSFYNATTTGNATFGDDSGPQTTIVPNTTGTKEIRVPLEVPSAMFGRDLKVKSVEVCYKRDGGAHITSTILYQGLMGSSAGVVSSSINRASDIPDCYVLSPGTPVAITGALYLFLGTSFPATTDLIHLYSITLTLTPAPGN